MIQDDSRSTNINGAELEYWDIGSGPPVLFIHGGMGDECAEVLHEPTLTSRFRLIHFQRRGYGRSSCPEMPVSVEQHSDDCQALLEFLGVHIAHVVGQSYGGTISLQLSMDAPSIVHSLTVLEPGLPSVLFSSPEFVELGQQASELNHEGRDRESIERFARAVVGEKGWDIFAEKWLERWMDDATVVFESDIPALGAWDFSSVKAGRILQPVLNLLGIDSPEVFGNISETVAEWIPHAESHVVPDTSHPIFMMNPSGAAQLITDFFERHPIAN